MNEDGEMVTVKKEESGPWNKKAGTNNNTEEKAQQEEKVGITDMSNDWVANRGGNRLLDLRNKLQKLYRVLHFGINISLPKLFILKKAMIII